MNCENLTATVVTMVCRKFLSFKHHAEVAALPPTEADALLDWYDAEKKKL